MKKMYLIFAWLLIFCTSQATFAQNIFIKVTAANGGQPYTAGAGVKKSVRDVQNNKSVDLTDYMPVTSLQYGTQNSTNVGQGTGAGTGRISFNDMEITKLVDVATARLMQASAEGRKLDVEILFISNPSDGTSYFVLNKIILGEAIVKTYSASGDGTCSSCATISESFSFNYGELQVYTYSQRNNGTAVANANPFSWSILTNSAVH